MATRNKRTLKPRNDAAVRPKARARGTSARRTILDRLFELSDQIPDEVHAKHPPDGAQRLDEYLNGTHRS
jgi:hypothetical protein